MRKTHGKTPTQINRDHGGVIPPRGDDQPRSRNTLFDAYCEIYRPLQGRRAAGSAASRAVDASSANQSALANCEARETQCQLLERVTARKSHRQFVRVFPQLQKWHIM